MARAQHKSGFTLMELSIVLVIIGLLVGGVMVGQDLIKGAAINSQVAQFAKYNAATHAFQSKYMSLPGDIPAATVAQFAFPANPSRPGTKYLGDGDGIIQGSFGGGPTPHIFTPVTNGEAEWYWEDLGTNAQLIDEMFHLGVDNSTTLQYPATTTMDKLIPKGKIGGGNYVYVMAYNGANYYGLSKVRMIDGNGAVYSDAGLSAQQAQSLDTKLDDGNPQTGSVIAKYLDWTRQSATAGPDGVIWSAGGGGTGTPDTSATPASSTTCYDNGGVAGADQHYTLSNTSNLNCGLIVKFQ